MDVLHRLINYPALGAVKPGVVGFHGSSGSDPNSVGWGEPAVFLPASKAAFMQDRMSRSIRWPPVGFGLKVSYQISNAEYDIPNSGSKAPSGSIRMARLFIFIQEDALAKNYDIRWPLFIHWKPQE